MMYIYKELLKSNVRLVRRVMAGTEPKDDSFIDMDLTDEFYDTYAEDWKEIVNKLYWIMAAVCVVSFIGGYLWGSFA